MKALLSESISNRYSRLKHSFTEQARRLWAASEAIELGYGGTSSVAPATGLMPATIRAGIAELTASVATSTSSSRSSRQRSPGGGRKSLENKDPQLGIALEKLMEPYTRGDPMRPLRWSCKSTAELALELTAQGRPVSAEYRRQTPQGAQL